MRVFEMIKKGAVRGSVRGAVLMALLAILLCLGGFSGPVQAADFSGASEVRIVAGDGDAADNFGHSVDMDGDTVVIGSPYDDVGANGDQGSAYVFVKSGTAWIQQAQLAASDGRDWDFFGHSVAVDGDTVAVGSSQSGGKLGSVYVFVRSGTVWTEQAKLMPSGFVSGDLFGTSVDISGDTIIAGSYGQPGGSAYIFVRSGTSWTEQAMLTASDPAYADNLGHSVAIDADTAVVGASHKDGTSGADQGAAYVFVRTGSAWSEQAKLTGSDGAAGDVFGWSAAIDGDSIVVGAPGNEGAAHVFVRAGSAWSEQAILTYGGSAEYSGFGASVGLSGDTVVVGAHHFLHPDSESHDYTSWADVFVRSGTVWNEQAQLEASDGAAEDHFGCSVAVDGKIAIVGAEQQDMDSAEDRGAAYIFEGAGTASIHIETYVSVDGGMTWEDADVAPGPVVAVGKLVRFRVVVCTNGDLPLSDILVTGRGFTPSVVAASLAPGECRAGGPFSVVAVAGRQRGGACVSAASPEGVSVDDCDPVHYVGVGAFGLLRLCCDSEGGFKEQYAAGQSVWAKGAGLDPNTTYKIWIQGDPVAEGDLLDVSRDPSGMQELVMTDENGDFPLMEIWAIPADAALENNAYVIILDRWDDGGTTGVCNASSDGIDSLMAVGFVPPVPELAPWVLLGMGLLTLGGAVVLLYRKRKTAAA